MRIDDLNRSPVTQGAQQTEQTAEKRTTDKNGNPAVSTDQANVSELAQALSSRDPQRLEQLRLQVESGNYNVPAETLANSIIDAQLKD